MQPDVTKAERLVQRNFFLSSIFFVVFEVYSTKNMGKKGFWIIK